MTQHSSRVRWIYIMIHNTQRRPSCWRLHHYSHLKGYLKSHLGSAFFASGVNMFKRQRLMIQKATYWKLTALKHRKLCWTETDVTVRNPYIFPFFSFLMDQVNCNFRAHTSCLLHFPMNCRMNKCAFSCRRCHRYPAKVIARVNLPRLDESHWLRI